MIAQLARGFHSLLFPVSCMGCRGSIEEPAADPVCSACRSRLPRCPFPWSGSGLWLDGGVSPFLYEGVCKEMVLALKYQGRISLVPFLADQMAEEVIRHLDPPATEAAPSMLPRKCHAAGAAWPDRIVPVPLHPVRLRERTFNQAELLARALSKKLAVPCESDLLIRCRPTHPQAELNRQERTRNVRGAFDLRGEARVKGSRILLVDDVFTTGSTAEACARLLKSAGARTVSVVTATYDPRKRDVSRNVPIS